ncbi:hypothetical protein BGW36DRAFT_302360 [Talaromyces proteolyticus]|uniref:FAD-binding domain-containing protein n=1 Tax=Talaromyces proteolyticus TaxID=1131652 RepID=A0AAD4KKW3_9EURO|nr:uncharacterized protein BGW36DRAFT_302360 [Talaromyces proteolyticus]KAH8692607.1 hypothetical protein BGW36DRAFT_302360 [Talaromyces proteolyticus]
MSSAKSSLRIAVIGGGISGLFAALSLHYHCGSQVSIDIYEQASQYKEIGAGVGIGVNAVKLLDKIGLGERVAAISGDRNGVWISFRRFDDNAEIITVPAVEGKVRQCSVHRAEFLDILLAAIKERGAARLWTNKQCRSISNNGSDVTVHFVDNTSSTADLVIGCDGIHSVIRSQYIVDKPQYSGRIAYRGLVPIERLKPWWPFPSYSASWLGIDKHFLAYPISKNDTLNIVAFVTEDESPLDGLQESWTATATRGELASKFADFSPTVRGIIEKMPQLPTKWLLNDREQIHQWVFEGGRVVLMGDAAHAMLPHQGTGAGQSIEDGYVLSRAIQDYLQRQPRRTLEAYTQLYQQVRLPRVQRAQETSRQAGHVYEMQTSEMVGLSYDDCLPIVCEQLKDRMKWVWNENLDEAYERARSVGIDN